MIQERYSVVSDNDHLTYEFLSEGPKGTIKKVVFYQEINDNLFNLAFGDWDETKQKIDDKIKSNNNDRNKVLATVALTAVDFIKYHPEALIFAEGSTPARTRLYQMGILANWRDINQSFDVEGFWNGKWESFEQHKNYQAFILKAK
jgi:hypothetical protein